MKKILKNNFFVYSIISIMILSVSCKVKKERINIEQLNTDYPVTFFKNNENSKMIRIFFRIPFEITSSVSKNYSLTSIDYYYSDEYSKSYLTIITKGWSRCISYNGKTNERITYNHPKLNNENPIYIYIETQHEIDTTAQVQLELKPYTDKMIELGQDTMSIPSFNEFKKEHPLLVKNLLQGDSISILIKKDLTKNPELFGDTIIKAAIKY